MMKDYDKYLNEIEFLFKAFSDKNRLTMIWLLASKTNENISVSEMSDLLQISQPAVTQHFKILKSIGLIYAIKDGLYSYYKIDFKRIEEIKTQLDNAFGDVFEKYDCNYECQKKNVGVKK